MRSRILSIIAGLLITVALLPHAFAQSGDDVGVTVLKFERFDVPDDVMETFYSELRRGIDGHPELAALERAEVTIQDLSLTAGCDEPDEACLTSLRDILDADQIVFGSVQQSENVYLFTIRNFDFAEERFVREVTEQTVEGDFSTLQRAIPAIVENFLYGEVGTLEVAVEGAQDAEIFVNGQKVGLAPTVLNNLPLGEHVVMVRTADGEEQSESVILRYDAPRVVSFQFQADSVIDDPVVADDAGPSTVPGWITVGVGVAGIGFGIFQTLAVSSIDDDFDALCAAEGNVCEGSSAALGSPQAAAEARSLEDDGSTAKTLQLVGFSVGGAAILVGSYLLYRAYSYEEPEPKYGTLDWRNLELEFGPTRDGAAASLGVKF